MIRPRGLANRIIERKTTRAEFRLNQPKQGEPRNIFRIEFRKPDGTPRGQVDVDVTDAKEFIEDLEALIASIREQIQ